MGTLDENFLAGLSDEELGRLFRERLNQNKGIESIQTTHTESQENWFQRIIRVNNLDNIFDKWQHNAEKEFGIDDE